MEDKKLKQGKQNSVYRRGASVLFACITVLLCACGTKNEMMNAESSPVTTSEQKPVQTTDSVKIQILCTSDMHGKYIPYDHMKNKEDYSGSLAQVATAVNEIRDDNTIIIDVGDFGKGDMSALFLNDDITPMVLGMNKIGYNFVVPGNHGFNYGTESFLKVKATGGGDATLCGNVYSSDGELIGEPYYIVEKSGVKIGIIGMTTPNIQLWDADNLKEWTVTDPVTETKKIISEIRDDVDVLVAAVHMDVENELGNEHTGVRDLAEACPELDLILASHGHTKIDDMEINGIPVIENADAARTLGVASVEMLNDGEKWTIESIDTSLLEMENYDPDPELLELLEPYHQRALEAAGKKIGVLKGGNLTTEDEITGIPAEYIQDTALTDLYSRAFMERTGVKVCSVNLGAEHKKINEGDIHLYDLISTFIYDNQGVIVKMNGKQLKKWMEWSAKFYNTYNEGDLTVSFNPNVRAYLYDMFEGVNYEINISKEPGSRIENLTWPDGTPVRDDDVFTALASDYRASAYLTTYGDIFKEGEELPEAVETEYEGRGEDVRFVIAYYIKNDLNGVLEPECNNNWKLTGYSFDEDMRQRAIKLVKEGKITVQSSPNGRTPNVKSITVEDVLAAEKG